MKKKYLKERKAKLNKEYYKNVESYKKILKIYGDNFEPFTESPNYTSGYTLNNYEKMYKELVPLNAPSWMKKTPVEIWNTPDDEPNYKKDITDLAWNIANKNTMDKEKKKKEEDDDEWLILN